VTDGPDQLIRVAADAAQAGNRQAARAILLALSREHPADVRVWLGLAGVAASRNEQREALERAVALDPDDESARLALARLAADTAPPAAAVAPQAAPPPGADHPQHTPFPLMNAIAAGLILLLLVALGVVLGRAFLGGENAAGPTTPPTPVLQAAPAGQPAPGATAAQAGDTPGAPTAAAQAEATAAPPTSTAPATPAGATATPPLVPSAPLPVTAPPLPAATAAPAGQNLTLPMGTPIDHDGWTAVLVRPDYVLPLDGAIGDLRPNGRFVLAVVAVSNNSPNPRVIPPDMFLLVDGQGQRYAPVPGASTAYLALYERAQRGDLALEDTFEPVVGLRSVPIIFDVPPDASGLRLTVNGAGPAGWPVGDTPQPSVPSGP
jgi:hypothetical protein